ncbi:MAG TPA: riboflavin biosynthesis protein RibF [Candidatus Rubrimentiphilum sp.]|nr:riboflavin biosynthesis protein RibF [Candidatus Rubrimentiphilum sp.]
MNLRYSLTRSDDAPLILAIGFFDGVHRGHRDIARHVLALRQLNGRAGVLTFANHPATFLRPGSEPHLITTPEERIDLLSQAGYDECFLVPFDDAIATQEPEDFLRRALIGKLRVKGVVVGRTFRFGHGRAGNVHVMQRVFGEAGVAFEAVENTIDDAGVRISSSRIREYIANGDLANADRLLGHPYEICGKVILGTGRGHGLGFPTANLALPKKLLPPEGVYAAVARHDGRDYAALVSIGTNPTFGEGGLTVEAWLRDFEETIYGREIALRDLRFVRNQRKFKNADELLAQMKEDAKVIAFPAYG